MPLTFNPEILNTRNLNRRQPGSAIFDPTLVKREREEADALAVLNALRRAQTGAQRQQTTEAPERLELERRGVEVQEAGQRAALINAQAALERATGRKAPPELLKMLFPQLGETEALQNLTPQEATNARQVLQQVESGNTAAERLEHLRERSSAIRSEKEKDLALRKQIESRRTATDLTRSVLQGLGNIDQEDLQEGGARFNAIVEQVQQQLTQPEQQPQELDLDTLARFDSEARQLLQSSNPDLQGEELNAMVAEIAREIARLEGFNVSE